MADTQTLQGPARLQQEIRKSRFLVQAAPIEDAEAALAFIGAVSARDASHNCWAYRYGDQYRFNDDGEPGGSAGRPILQAIDSQGLDHVVVVVTRWFGGIKLGVGGLARAYGGCAAECLRLAPRIMRLAQTRLRVECDFALAPLLHARLREFGARKLAEAHTAQGLSLDFELPQTKIEAFTHFVREASRGRADIRPTPIELPWR
ncbi:YigZ family protein [Dokdonella sp.]|uniref:IMPACT family protein n=1 Tax=Dokdonella sp. TaxID=2291710 RepID=UPI0025BE257E|nr:YigZ family protein [Dokdonella sp.]MBX3688318.1 YigZ family protein [Dokdonella sp.]